MTPEERTLAESVAARHSLPSDLVCAVIEQESAWNRYAMRYEPEFFNRYMTRMVATSQFDPAKPSGAASKMTEAHARATSWGLMQIMGQTAREFGFKGIFFSELCDPGTGIEFGCRKLARCIEKHPGDMRNALLAYNGGGNLAYPDEVLARRASYLQPS